jgi:CubicO group peptidase (beta-lactamase class C family)
MLKNVSGTDIDSLLKSVMIAYRIPGMAACAIKGGSITWEGYYGLANVQNQDSVRQNTTFAVASISKTVTATALMQLWEHGRFQLDDSINAYLPFVVRNPKHPSAAITFRHLLSHVSSIVASTNVSRGDPTIALETYLRDRLTPGGAYYYSGGWYGQYTPGTGFTYSNMGIALCGYLVEVITGIPFEQYCRDSIFVPLGMTNTAWFLRDLDTSLIAHPYVWNQGNQTYQDIGLYGMYEYPAGQLRTTARDLGRFLLAHLNYGRLNAVRILDSSTVRLMRTVHYPFIDPTQGLVWYWVSPTARLVWGHFGGLDGVRTGMWLDEEARSGVIVFTNTRSAELDASFNMLIDPLFALVDTTSTASIHVVQFGGSLGDSYTPNAMRVTVGDTVEWFGDFTAHPLHSSAIPLGASAWQCAVGKHFFYVVQTPGVYQYYGGPEGSGMAGSFTAVATGVDGEHSAPPVSFQLSQNYPNPFNPSTQIRLENPVTQHLSLTVYDVLGRMVTTLLDGEVAGGSHSISWDASAMPSGLYFYTLKGTSFTQTRRMVLLR